MEPSMAHQVVLEEKILENLKLKQENKKLREENFDLKEAIEELESHMRTAPKEVETFDTKDSDGDADAKVEPLKLLKTKRVIVFVTLLSGGTFQSQNVFVLKVHLSTKMRDFMWMIHKHSKILPHNQELVFTDSTTRLECYGRLSDHDVKDMSSIDVKDYTHIRSSDIGIEVYSLKEKLVAVTFTASKLIKELKPMLGVVKDDQRLVLACIEYTFQRSIPVVSLHHRGPTSSEQTIQKKINPGIAVFDLDEDGTLSDVLSMPAVRKCAEVVDTNTPYLKMKLLFRLV